MSLFDTLGQKNDQMEINRQQALQEIKADPTGVLKRHGFSIPAGTSDPMQIISHLVQTGQVGGPRLHMIQKMMGQIGHR